MVAKRLPKNYNQADLTASDITDIIRQVSRAIDARLSVIYIPFNSTADTPPTPDKIQDIATHLATAKCVEILMPLGRNAKLAEWAQYNEEWAEKRLSMLESGSQSLPDETQSAQTLTPGVGGQYDVQTYEALLTPSAVTSGEIPTIITDSVRINSPSAYTQYRYERDFHVYFEPQLQRWVFQDHRNEFLAQPAPKVDYRWTWQRHTWNRDPGPIRTNYMLVG